MIGQRIFIRYISVCLIQLMITIVNPIESFSDVNSQKNIGNVSNSVARLSIKSNHGQNSNWRTASGFLWPSNEYIVTNLHAVIGADYISAELRGGKTKHFTNATVVKIFKSADLALLKLSKPANSSPLIISKSIPSSHEELHVVGYPLGMFGLWSRKLKRSIIAPKNLRDGLDSNAENQIRKLGFPELDIGVFHLEGSLLPGDSGAPIVDNNGELVAIGNGGLLLNSGITGLCWAIPVKYLSKLDIAKGGDINIAPESLNVLMNLFYTKIDTKREEEAIWKVLAKKNTMWAYEQYLERYPFGVYRKAAELAIETIKGKYSMAMDYYRRALDYQEKIGIGGTEEYIIENNEEAIWNLKQAIKVYPEFEKAYFQTGYIHYMSATMLERQSNKKKEYRQAILALNSAIELNQDYAEAYLFRGFSYSQMEEYRYACEDYINFQRLKHTLPDEKFKKYLINGRFSRNFLNYHGCKKPLDIDYLEIQDAKGPKDNCKSLLYQSDIERCAENGVIDAMIKIAESVLIYDISVEMMGPKKTKAVEKATRYAHLLAEKNDVRAFYILGEMYINGIVKPIDNDLGFDYLNKAAQAGHSEAQESLGFLYFNGTAGKRNFEEARLWWQRAAVNGQGWAKHQLKSYDQQIYFTKKNIAEVDDNIKIINEYKIVDKYDRIFFWETLGKILDVHDHALDAVDDLVYLYERTDDHDIKNRVIFILRRIGAPHPDVIKLLISIIDEGLSEEYSNRINNTKEGNTIKNAISAVGSMGIDAKPALPSLIQNLKSKDRLLKACTVWAIGKIGAREHLDIIRKYENDQSHIVRIECKRAIDTLRAK